jgi:hypothetical protein
MQIYNNETGVLLTRSENNYLNNVLLYNHSLSALSFQVDSRNNHMNNIFIFNNQIPATVDNTSQPNIFHGLLYAF